jgi:predicted DCC family thiol-disulfide oxidoreductase YuxK
MRHRSVIYSAVTERRGHSQVRGWIGFDAECPHCASLARRLGPLARRHRFAVVPLQTPWVQQRLALAGLEPLTELRLLTADGRIFGGADALLAVARRIWWARPVVWVSAIPGVKAALRAAYRFVARHRACMGWGWLKRRA